MKKSRFFASTQTKFMTAARILLTAILLMTGLNGAWAYEWTGNTVAAGQFYLYNVEEGKFLSFGANWSTRAVLVEDAGEIVTLAGSGANYTVTFNYITKPNKHLYLSNNIPFCDGAETTWTFTETSAGSKIYYLSTGGRYLSAQDYANHLTYPLVTVGNYSSAPTRAQWKLVSRADRIAALSGATPLNPVDATFYIADPEMSQYLNNASFWAGNEPNFGGTTGNREETGYAAEFFNGTGVMESYQTLSGLPEGSYGISCYGFYRDGAINEAYNAYQNGTENIKSWLFANNETAQFSSIFTGAHDANRGGDTQLTGAPLDGKYIPNDMASAVLSFYDGSYPRISAETFINNGDNLRIGVRRDNANQKWTIWDNFRLTYYGPYATSTDWDRLEMALNSHTWGFDNGEYAPYNNVAAAVSWSNAKAFFDAHAHDGSAMVRASELYTHISNLNDATWTANVGEVNAFCWDYSRYTDNADSQTPIGFTGGNGGTIRISANYGANAGLNSLTPKMVLNLQAGTTYGETPGYTMPLKATTSYELTFKYGGWGGDSGTPTITVTDPSGTTVASRALISVPAAHDGSNSWNSVTIYFNTTTAGNYKVSFPNDKDKGNARTAFGELKIFRMNTVGTIPAKVEGDLMRKEVYDEQNAAYAAWEGANTSYNYVRVLNAHEEAVKSHECYVIADEAVTMADFMLNHTNVYTVEAYTTFMDLYEPQRELFEDRIMEDVEAKNLLKTIFGNRDYHQRNVPVVPFLGSAWDDAGDYTWSDYWVNTWSIEGNTTDYTGTYPQNYPTPFMEYWVGDGNNLPDKTITATVPATKPNTAYTVTANVRIRTNDGNAPSGISMKVGGGNAVTIGGTKDGNYYFSKPVTASGKPSNGQLTIQFIVSGTTNVSWLCFRDVWVNYAAAGDIADWTAVETAINEGSGKTLGFWGTEYAPYTNAEKLQALEELKEYYRTRASNPNPVLVSTALNKYNSIS